MNFLLLGSLLLTGILAFKTMQNSAETVIIEEPHRTITRQLHSRSEGIDLRAKMVSVEKQIFRGLGRLSASLENLRGTDLKEHDYFNVRLELRPTLTKCKLGSLDLMRLASKSVEKKSFMLTVESLDEKNSVLFRKKLQLEDIQSRASMNIPIPIHSSMRQYGLFICSNQAGNTSCSRFLYDTQSPSDVFAFHHVLTKERRLLVLTGANKNRLAANLSPVEQLRQYSALSFSQEAYQKTVPGHISYHSGKLIMDFEYHDPKCFQ